MTIRWNLNTVDYSQEETTKLLAALHSLRQSESEAIDQSDSDDYSDKAEDIWSVLYTRQQADPVPFSIVDELFEQADRGELSEDDYACLLEGFLP